MKKQALSFDVLHDGHEKTLTTALRLLSAGMDIAKTYPEIALGLFEIGQEEIGKSFSFLAAFGYDPDDRRWANFWKAWRNHQTKAYRAFFYEWFSPVRITAFHPSGQSLNGLTRKKTIPHEKESAFYIDYDPVGNRFVSPGDQTEPYDWVNRSGSLISLLNTAKGVRGALERGDKPWTYRTFSEIPQMLLDKFTLQQEMPAHLDDFGKRSPRHSQLVKDLSESLRTE